VQLEVLPSLPDGGSLSARRPPLLFVHGSWHGAWCWDEHFLRYFRDEGWAAHALSLRGHGKSEGRERLRRFRLWDYVADVLQIAEQLPAPPVLIGHSLGGAIVQKYLELPDAPLAGAVLMASVPPAGMAAGTVRLLGRHFWATLAATARFSLWPLVATPARAKDLLFSDDMPDAQAAAYQAKLQDESYFSYLDTLILNRPRPALRARSPLPPLLVVGAADDRIVLPQEVEATAQAYDTVPVSFPGMAHDLMLEKGWEDVAKHILCWLSAQHFPPRGA